MDTLEYRLKSLDNLPAVPAALARLITLLGDENADSAEIERTVQMDQALSLSTLRLANSALFGGMTSLSSVNEAVRRLGARNMMKVVITHFANQTLSHSGRGYGLEGGESWEGALAGGIAAESVAEMVGKQIGVDPGVAFTAGLLRDCGKLAMDQLVGVDSLRGILEQDGLGEQTTVETDLFGFDHAEVGAELAKLWGLGEQLQDAIRLHHAPPTDGSNPLADVVCVADTICTHLGYGVGLDGMHYVLHTEVLDRLGIDRESFAILMSNTAERISAFGAESDDSGKVAQ